MQQKHYHRRKSGRRRYPPQHSSTPSGVETERSGVLEITAGGAAYLRSPEQDLLATHDDCLVERNLVAANHLRSGMLLKVIAQSNGRKQRAIKILEINGVAKDDYRDPVPFDRQISVDPHQRYVLTPARNPQSELSMRFLELFAPIGKGQRTLIVAPPKTGKTTLLLDLASSIADHHPETNLIALLIDERPEEVTHFKRMVRGTVIASSSDKEAKSHLHVARLTLDMARNLAEHGKDVFLVLDSLTRLGRASNREEQNRGKTLSGGIGSRALEFPRRFFGSARKLEDGGSLTIVATALIDTGSRMDEVIFQEFKGTGNMELVLDRFIADRRIFPAVDFGMSGTRKEEKILPPDWLEASRKIRRHLATLKPAEALEVLLDRLQKAESVQSFSDAIAK